jgi:hypothetical protein
MVTDFCVFVQFVMKSIDLFGIELLDDDRKERPLKSWGEEGLYRRVEGLLDATFPGTLRCFEVGPTVVVGDCFRPCMVCGKHIHDAFIM